MKHVLTIAAIGGLALSLAACSSGGGSTTPSSSGPKLADGKTFTMVLGADPGNLDPDMTSLSAALQTDLFLYDSLVNIDKDGTVVSGLAQSWQGTTTGATYVLRKGVTCSDGTPLTATTVADNINFVGDVKNASSRVGVYVPPGATAKGDDATGTVTVTSPAPSSFLVRTVGGLPIVCGKGMGDRGTLKEGADGTGMFTLSEAVPGDHYTLTRRTDYAWGPGDWQKDQHGLPDKVVIKIVTNETTAANLLTSGQVNSAQVIGPDRQRLEAQKLFSRDVEAPLGEMWFNHKAGLAGSDEAVRKALVQALDLSQLGNVVSSGSGKPATGLVAPDLSPCPGNTVDGNLPKHDLDGAKAALDADGWVAGADGVRVKNGQKLSVIVDYASSVGAGNEAGAEMLQQAWQGLGVNVTLKAVTDAEVGTAIVGGQGSWDVAMLPLGVTLPSQLVPFLSGPGAPNGVNFSGIDNADYSTNVQAASALAGGDGCSKWSASEAAIFQHVDMVPFVDSTIPTFAKGAEFEFSQGSLEPQSIRMLG
jgi:peptide/nickel transport system substrate-binding protein